MQKSHLTLNEIIWEVTGRCENHCKYCGSKEAWNEKIDEDRITKIVNEIVKFPPKQIDISGGDPLLVSYETHEWIVNSLRRVGVIVKVIINPKSFKPEETATFAVNRHKLLLYDWIGISVNSKEELGLANDLIHQLNSSKYTIISNFNLENIFIFDEIKQFVKQHNCAWQIQYTVYNDEENPLAIYNNNEAMMHFFKLVSDSMKDTKIILADNMTEGGCGAGLCSIGLLADGTVVPCLSMRSWVPDIMTISQGNILKEELEKIWWAGFDNYRFKEFKCCKDFCKNKAFCMLVKEMPEVTPLTAGHYKIEGINGKNPLLVIKPNERIIVYGVNPYPYDGKIYMYAVKPWDDQQPRVVMYGVGNEHTYVYAVPHGDLTGRVTAVYAVSIIDEPNTTQLGKVWQSIPSTTTSTGNTTNKPPKKSKERKDGENQ